MTRHSIHQTTNAGITVGGRGGSILFEERLRLSDFLIAERPIISITVANALCRFHAFSAEVLAGGFDSALRTLAPEAIGGSAVDILNRLAEKLAGPVRRSARDLFEKSVKEALFLAAALEDHLTLDELGAGIAAFLRQRSSADLLQFLLNLYVFNSVWFKIQDSVRAADCGEWLDSAVTEIERTCETVVASVLRGWRSQKNPRMLDGGLAGNFLLEVEKLLVEAG